MADDKPKCEICQDFGWVKDEFSGQPLLCSCFTRTLREDTSPGAPVWPKDDDNGR